MIPRDRTLLNWLYELKVKAMVLGQFPKKYWAPCFFDNRNSIVQRDKFKPFRCSAYNLLVRRINCLETLMYYNKVGKE